MTGHGLELIDEKSDAGNALSVLIVDDSEDDAILLLRHLEASWPAVRHRRVESRADLAAALATERWDVVLCDCHLPTLSVTSALDTVLEHDPGMPVIMVTGAVGEDELIHLVRHGAHDIVLKNNLARLRPAIWRELAEARLRREKDRAEVSFSNAIESVSQGIALYDRDDRLTWTNRRYWQVIGGTAPPATAGRTYEDILRDWAREGRFEDLGAGADDFVRLQLKRHRAGANCSELQLRAGRWVTIEDNPTRDGGIVSVLTDITERKALDIMKNEFVSVVSHELRTPLTALVSSIELLQSEVLGAVPAEAGHMLEIARRNGARLTTLVNDILEIEKIEIGHLEFDFGPVELVSMIRASLAEYRPHAEQLGVGIRFEPEIAAADVIADAGRLAQVMFNLLSNAVKFTPAGKEVQVHLGRGEDGFRICVADQGPGIPETMQAVIFEKFRQLDSSDSRQKSGTGLGLSIAQAIVTRHGGRIGVNSAPGHGAEFYFELGASAGALARSSRKAA
jgi:signal transduction histidine kinase